MGCHVELTDSFFSSLSFLLFSYKFNDTEMSDHDTCRVTLRMFLEFDLINKFQIPYKVRSITIAFLNKRGKAFKCSVIPGSMPLDSEREEELPASEVPQLETCPQCLPNYVHCPQNWKNGLLYEWSWGDWYSRGNQINLSNYDTTFFLSDFRIVGSLPMPRSRPPWDQQRFPV